MSFLGMEPLLKARLEPIVAPFGAVVLTVSDIGDATEDSLPVPSVRIVYAGYRPIPDQGGHEQIEQTWFVIVAVRNVADVVGGEDARAEASPLLDACWDALNNWMPGKPYKSLQPATPPAPRYRTGCGYYPLAFTTRFRRSPPCA